MTDVTRTLPDLQKVLQGYWLASCRGHPSCTLRTTPEAAEEQGTASEKDDEAFSAQP